MNRTVPPLRHSMYVRNIARIRIQRKTLCMGPYNGVDNNLTLCPLQSRHQHIYHGQPYARVDLNSLRRVDLNSQSGTLDLSSEVLSLSLGPKRRHRVTEALTVTHIQRLDICTWKGAASTYKLLQ
jgi:hypothetical protein